MAKTNQPQPKHIPMRTCIGTGVRKSKKEMVRLVRLPTGEVIVDLTGKARGRGANIDMSIDAFESAVKKQAIERALKLEQKLKSDELAKLRSDFLLAIENKTFRQGNKPITVRVGRDHISTD